MKLEDKSPRSIINLNRSVEQPSGVYPLMQTVPELLTKLITILGERCLLSLGGPVKNKRRSVSFHYDLSMN